MGFWGIGGIGGIRGIGDIGGIGGIECIEHIGGVHLLLITNRRVLIGDGTTVASNWNVSSVNFNRSVSYRASYSCTVRDWQSSSFSPYVLPVGAMLATVCAWSALYALPLYSACPLRPLMSTPLDVP